MLLASPMKCMCIKLPCIAVKSSIFQLWIWLNIQLLSTALHTHTTSQIKTLKQDANSTLPAGKDESNSPKLIAHFAARNVYFFFLAISSPSTWKSKVLQFCLPLTSCAFIFIFFVLVHSTLKNLVISRCHLGLSKCNKCPVQLYQEA